MAAETTKKILDDLDLSNDEVNKLKKAFDDPEFRKLFKEYAEELNDPENRRKYEEEITQMENDRGMNVQFVKPNPGYVIKTNQNGTEKTFINICQCDLIGKPKVEKEQRNGKVGANWSLPYSLAPGRDDMDKSRTLCKVYDVVFHPDTYHMASKNERFRSMIEDTAFDAIERQFQVKIDRKNTKRPKIKFKGTPVATVIRTKREDFDEKQIEPGTSEDPLPPFPYPYDEKKPLDSMNSALKDEPIPQNELPHTEPKYKIKYSHNFDIQNYGLVPSDIDSNRPNVLVVEIELPLIRSAGCVDLDITETRLKLVVEKPACYLLDLKLTYPVDEAKGSAKFDKTSRRLVVTLPVKLEPKLAAQHQELINGDSNSIVESETDISVDNENSLIEVLGSETFQEVSTTVKDSVIEQMREMSASTTPDGIEFVDDCDLSTLSSMNVKFPDIQFHQDNLHLIILFNVKHVALGSVKVSRSIHNPNCLAVSMVSQGKGGWPMQYAAFLGCCSSLSPDENNSGRPRISLSISEDNMVICLKKMFSGFWSMLQIGPNVADLKEILLPLENSLQKLMAELNTTVSATKPESSDAIGHLQPQVAELDQNKIDIRLVDTSSIIPNSTTLTASQCADKRVLTDLLNQCDGEDERLPPIVIVESSNGPRPAKSILKTRSISNSSEESPIGHSAGGFGSMSSEDFPGQQEGDDGLPRCASLDSSSNLHHQLQLLRKSVSFSQRQERALFTPADPVSALHQTLRNRRKKARRRGKGARRHSTSGDGEGEVDEEVAAAEAEEESATMATRRRIFSEGDLDRLSSGYTCEPPHPWVEVTSNRGKRTATKPSDEPPKTPVEIPDTQATTNTKQQEEANNNQQAKPLSNRCDPPSRINWTDLPGVQQRQNAINPHRTKCAVSLSDKVTFDLDDD